MPFSKQLAEEAQQIASQLQGAARALDREKAELEARLGEIEAKGKTARLVPQRLLDFQPTLNGDFQCPMCWVRDSRHSNLFPVGGGTKTKDLWRCHICHSYYFTPA